MTMETPFGAAWAAINPDGALEAFGFGAANGRARGSSAAVAKQIHEYCEGVREVFELDLAPKGTSFQQRVWAELMKIPLGETLSYAELAVRAGVPGAARAAGRANATNPVALVIPCHRVIGSNGALTGYAYGTDLKRRLLEWEKTVRNRRAN